MGDKEGERGEEDGEIERFAEKMMKGEEWGGRNKKFGVSGDRAMIL